MKITWLLAVTFLAGSLTAFALPATVEVVGAEGKPIAGASVQFESFGTPNGTFLQTTDEAGRTVFEVAPGAAYPRFLGRIVVWKEGLALAGGDLKLEEGVGDRAALQIELQPATVVRGTVVDQAGQPVAGALISYGLMGVKTGDGISRVGVPVLYDGPLLQRVQTRSDAAGQWEFDSLPPHSVAVVSAVARGYIRARARIEAGTNAEIRLAPGAIVRGTVVGLNGQPLEGIEVSAQGTNPQSNDMWANTKTDAAGRYELLGLGSGEFNVSFSLEREADTVLAAHAETRTRVGETLELGETRAQTGFEIGGVVRDEAGKPVAGAMIGVYGPRRPASSAAVDNAISDANGRWKLRTLAGANKIYLMGPPAGFVRDSQTRDETLNGPRADFDFVLKRTIPVSGVMVDEAGNPVIASVLASMGKGGEYFFISPTKTGAFQAEAPVKGRFTLAQQGDNNPLSDWELVSPRSIDVPSQSLRIVMKPRPFEGWTIYARDPDGRPIEGAQANYSYGNGNNPGLQVFTSDAKGAIRVRKPRSGRINLLEQAEKTGFDYLRGGEIENGAPTDLVFAPRDGALRGRVLNAQGAPEQGARVWAWNAETRSDGTGNYALENLAHNPVEAIALRDGEFGRGKGEIRLAPQTLQRQDRERARQIAAELENVSLPELYGRRPAILPLESLADWEAQKPATAAPDQQDSARQSWLQAALELPAVSTERLLAEARQIQSPVSRLDYVGQLWRARNDAPAFDSAPFGAELPALQKAAGAVLEGDDSWSGLRALLSFAVIQEGLGDQNAALQTFNDAAKRLWRQGDQPGDGSVVTPGSILGQNSDAVGESELLLGRIDVLLDRESEGRFYLLRNRAFLAAKRDGLSVAQPYLSELREMLKGEQPPNVRLSRPAFYAEVVRDLLKNHADSAPREALQLARSIPPGEDSRDNMRAEAVSYAALALPLEEARPLWDENVESIAPLGRAMSVVWRIKARDANLAQTLYGRLRARADQPDPNALWGALDPRMVEDNHEKFAFYEADFDPARARFRLEKAWGNPRNRTQELVRAMTKLDAARALEWAAQLPVQPYEPAPAFWALRFVAQWLYADETARQKLASTLVDN